VERALALWAVAGQPVAVRWVKGGVSGLVVSARAWVDNARTSPAWETGHPPWGVETSRATAGASGAKPGHHSRLVMPATASQRPRGRLVSRPVQACRVRGSIQVARGGRAQAPSSRARRSCWAPVTISRLQRLERGIFFGSARWACSPRALEVAISLVPSP